MSENLWIRSEERNNLNALEWSDYRTATRT